MSNFCDFFIILSASSGKRSQTIAENIQEGLKKEKLSLKSPEGSSDSGWILLDLFDVVVHIFEAQAREFYNLDRLWADAPAVKLPKSLVSPSKKIRGSKGGIKKNASRKSRKPTPAGTAKNSW